MRVVSAVVPAVVLAVVSAVVLVLVGRVSVLVGGAVLGRLTRRIRCTSGPNRNQSFRG